METSSDKTRRRGQVVFFSIFASRSLTNVSSTHVSYHKITDCSSNLTLMDIFLKFASRLSQLCFMLDLDPMDPSDVGRPSLGE